MTDRMLACCARDAASHVRWQSCSGKLGDAMDIRSALIVTRIIDAAAPRGTPASTAPAHRHTRMSMSTTCTGACVGERRLIVTDQRPPTPSKRSRVAHTCQHCCSGRVTLRMTPALKDPLLLNDATIRRENWACAIARRLVQCTHLSNYRSHAMPICRGCARAFAAA